MSGIGRSGSPQTGPNNYVLGRVHEHNVVLAWLASGVYGTNAAARVARHAEDIHWTAIWTVGEIEGGISNLPKRVDIRLGAVGVSEPENTYGGMVQFRLGGGQAVNRISS
ncbi:uncharacterized protein PV06_11003 [Exophiala oligosperma]|uniref:Uncharacterized protein n=1 Tax=Exophiala oligosperma TaxID=215243 RepID=A0A0D2DME1_9EURO|nr:uncharacterized protein PV06_11003 [Exophiala oligosperma]KIW36889.1 hypothetical protein PV06_11003 [Exophiala oligosperma]